MRHIVLDQFSTSADNNGSEDPDTEEIPGDIEEAAWWPRG